MLSLLPCLSLLAPALVLAQTPVEADPNEGDFQFALLRYEGGTWNPRANGLPRMAWELRRRTSVAVNLTVATVDPSTEELFQQAFVVWQGDSGFPPLPQEAINNLRHWVTSGGTLLVDVSDGGADGAFDRDVRRELRRIFPDRSLARVPSEHVMYKSFYLVDRHGGRVPARPYLEALYVEDRLAVMFSSNDLAGAVARDEFGEWDYDVGVGGEAAREATFRLVVNMVMYALCLDYKDDQVHIRFILQRRR